jgi:hypothetical protein
MAERETQTRDACLEVVSRQATGTKMTTIGCRDIVAQQTYSQHKRSSWASKQGSPIRSADC